MTTTLDAPLVYERYMALSRLAAERLGGTVGGRFLLYGRADDYGSACALAGNISGAATLGLDGDAEELKLAIRNGVCDFMVNSLDEALRILKNEIRKKQPVSVCLQQGCSDAIAEMATRGVQPDILALTPEDSDGNVAAIALLIERGAVALPHEATMTPGSAGVSWSVEDFPALWLPKVDALAAEVCGDELRRRWLRLAPRYLGRRAHSLRYVEMTEPEAETFAKAIRKSLDKGSIEVAVLMRFGGRDERFSLTL
jgi:Urocanase Rossmann-like domain